MLTRAQYPRELRAWIFLPVMLGVLEGGAVGVLVKIGFAGTVPPLVLDIAVAMLAAAPAFANILSFMWATASHGRNKVRFATRLMIVTAMLVALVAVAPRNTLGLWLIVFAVVAARMFWSGVITLRSTVWRANYPPHERARLAGNFSAMQAIVVAATATLLGLALERWDDAFRFVYPIAAVVGVFGAMQYNRIRVRGHRALINRERAHAEETNGRAIFDPRAFINVLRDDRRFRNYMLAMFVFGFGNLMVLAPLVLVVTERFQFTHFPAMLVTAAIPVALMPITIPFWSQYFDRVHILQYRSIHCWVFVTMIATVAIAALFRIPELLFVSAIIKGVAFGGGVLGWNLGHHDFAPKHLASQYMGVHVTLTGMRGIIAPFIGVPLYRFFENWKPGMGGLVFLVCLAISLTGAIWFQVLRHRSKSWATKAGE